MEDFVNVLSPVIYWTIRDYQTCENVLSPTFTFFGFKWRLKFTRFMDVDGLKAQILLESLSESNTVNSLPIDCETKVQRSSKFDEVKTVVLENEICCVWSSTISQLSKSYPSYKRNIEFSIKLAPSRSSSNQEFLNEEHKKQDTPENISLMKSLLKDFGSLFNNKDYSDYELKCEELRLAVHKAILSVRSNYFAALFSSPMKESDKNCVEFQNIEPETLEHVIRYFYTGTLPEMSLDTDTVHKVYTAADMFLCESLKAKCVPLMMENFIKEDQTVSGEETEDPSEENSSEDPSEENSSEDPSEENSSEDPKDCKELLKKLYLTREWKVFYDLYPDLAYNMSKPILFGTVKI